MRQSSTFVVVLAVALGTACGAAQLVETNANGGTVLLSGMRFEAMSKAGDRMRAHCRGPYSIAGESHDPNGDLRVSFVCGGVTGLTDSEYPPQGFPTTLVPDSSNIGL